MNFKIKNYIIFIILFVTHSVLQTAPFVINFVNAADINVNAVFHFSDNSIDKKGISVFQSYQVVDFPKKTIKSVTFTSLDKDKNGNFYGQLNQKFPKPKNNVTYKILLQDVPSHIVPAGPGNEEFKMPATQEIVCKVVSSKKNKKIKK